MVILLAVDIMTACRWQDRAGQGGFWRRRERWQKDWDLPQARTSSYQFLCAIYVASLRGRRRKERLPLDCGGIVILSAANNIIFIIHMHHKYHTSLHIFRLPCLKSWDKRRLTQIGCLCKDGFEDYKDYCLCL